MASKRLLGSLAAALLIALSQTISGQEKCKVLVPQLVGEYSGKCKKGFANGRGTAKGVDSYEGQFKMGYPEGKGEYKWSTGERYSGEWKKGKRDGTGIFYYFDDNEPAEMEGMWIDDQFAGPIPKPPRVIVSIGIERYNFTRQGDGNQVYIKSLINGTPTTDLQNVSIAGSSGAQYMSGSIMGYQNVNFPFRCKLSYLSWNKLHTSQNSKTFEFEILEPGQWLIVLHNN
jgi:hypothetical protein